MAERPEDLLDTTGGAFKTIYKVGASPNGGIDIGNNSHEGMGEGEGMEEEIP